MTDKGVAARDPGGTANIISLDAARRRRNTRAVEEMRAMLWRTLAKLADAADGGAA